MKTSLIIGILVLLAMPAVAQVAANGFSVHRNSVGIPGGNPPPPPANGVNDVATGPNAPLIGWQIFNNFIAPPVPGRPWGPTNLGNTGNGWFNPALLPPYVPLPLQANDNIDALDILGDNEIYGGLNDEEDPVFEFLFSVDRNSVGSAVVPNDVANVIAIPRPGAQATSIFSNTWGPPPNRVLNRWCLDGVEIGLPDETDELDGYDNCPSPNLNNLTIIFSLDAASPSLVPGGFSAADLFLWNFSFGTWACFPAAGLGLQQEDDLDALVILTTPHPNFPNFIVAFSLAPGSPSLAGGWSAADILLSNAAGVGKNPVILRLPELQALQSGLDPDDNIDALDTLRSSEYGRFGASFDGEGPCTDYYTLLFGSEWNTGPLFGGTADALTTLSMSELNVDAVPEPSTMYMILGCMGAVGAGVLRRLSRRH